MKIIKKLWTDSCFDRYALELLIAIELLLSFTFLGYIHIPPISITTAYIPILIAGCLFGPAESLLIGFVFGLSSMYKASASYVLPSDAAFSPFLSPAPVNSILLSVGVRMLFGLLIGLAFSFASKRKHPRIWRVIISTVAPKFHSLLVYTAMGFLFPALGYRYTSALDWDWVDAVIAAVCVVSVELLWAIYHHRTVQNVKSGVDQPIDNPYKPKKMNLFFAAFEFFLLFMAVLAARYFSQRESYMLQQHGVAVSHTISYDLLHLQLQFLFASLALNLISVIFLIMLYKYMAFKKYQGELDELTGIMGRRMFLYHCNRLQQAAASGAKRLGWFLFVDADYFKQVNDNFGHATGDLVLKAIASNLHHIFKGAGTVGRIGGDEFAVIIEAPLSPQELGQRLERFLSAIADTLPDKKTSCSIGAYQFVFPQSVKHLLSETDQILYKAKENGRACYVLKECGWQAGNGKREDLV